LGIEIPLLKKVEKATIYKIKNKQRYKNKEEEE
jgi:hypothetical protein